MTISKYTFLDLVVALERAEIAYFDQDFELVYCLVHDVVGDAENLLNLIDDEIYAASPEGIADARADIKYTLRKEGEV